ncbi:MAG TPA: TolC family protein [Thermoanaerobaculia bacterium]|nr:TolC family protein [Thermoanaerobaculia bacterium]
MTRRSLRVTTGNRARRWAAVLVTGLMITAGLAGRAHAQIPIDTVGFRPPETIEPPLEVRDNAIQLSLDDAIELALRRNLNLVVERYIRRQSELGIEQTLGLYDLLSTASVSATRAQTLGGAGQTLETDTRRGNANLTQRLPIGGDLTFGMSANRLSSADPRNPGEPSGYNSGFTFSYDQPLLRNFGRLPNERNILLAQIDNRVGREAFEVQVAATIEQVGDAYWALVEAYEQLGVAQESLSLARELHERNRIQVEVGTLAPLELVQSEAAIAERDEAIIRAQATIGDSADTLRQLLNLPQGDLWQTEIRPTTEPVTERVPINVDEAIRTALAERPEVRRQQLFLERNQLDVRYFRNQLLPRLDLALDYNLNGIQALDISEAFGQLTGFDYPGWTTQIIFAYPLQNRTARAQKAIADIDVERAVLELSDIENVVTTEVRQAARRVDTAAKQIDAARASRQFQDRNLDAEKKRYENGMSTSFQITQIQEDLTLARSREVTATIAYRTALTEFYRVTGRLLEQENVQLSDPEKPIERFTLW